MTTELFDRNLRSLRRDRAAQIGPEMFLFDRVFDECLDRLRDISRSYEQALLIGCPSLAWPERMKEFASDIKTVDPGKLFAQWSGSDEIEEDHYDFGEDRFDLCVTIGTLDTVNDLPLALQLIRRSLRRDAPLIGAIAGGNSLRALRASFIDADRAQGRAVARTHPRIEASSLAQILSAAGYAMPVVDVDRIRLRYASLDNLIRDLRAMGATSVLAHRAPALSKSDAELARRAFAALASDGRTEELVEILHFVGWNQ